MVSQVQQIQQLLIKEWLSKTLSHIFWSILLFIFSTIFLLYLTLGQVEDVVWNGLFWVTQIFVIMNTVTQNFTKEQGHHIHFLYFIVSPSAFIFSRLIYNTIHATLYLFISFLAFVFFWGMPHIHFLYFILLTLIGTWGFSHCFTFLNAIAVKAKQGFSLVAVLGFPLITPQIILIDKVSHFVFEGQQQNVSAFVIIAGLLVLYNVLILTLSSVLFPFLWHD